MTFKNIFKKDLTRQISGLAIIVFYFIGILAQQILLSPINEMKFTWLSSMVSIFYSFLLIIALGWFAKDLFIKSFKQLKKEHLVLFKKYLPYWFIALAGMAFFNLIANQINGGAIAENENSIRTMFLTKPLFVYFSAVLIAPMIEEIVFRASFYQIFKNKYVFILISGLTFGAIHVLPGLTDLRQLAFIIPYSIPGIVFAYALYDSKNIFVPMGLHFMHNGVLMSLQVFFLIIGVL